MKITATEISTYTKKLIAILKYFKEDAFAMRYFRKAYIDAVRYRKLVETHPSRALFVDIDSLETRVNSFKITAEKSQK